MAKTKKLTKAQAQSLLEDDLFRAACRWQNFMLTYYSESISVPEIWPMKEDRFDREACDAGASAALSELATLVEFVNADDSPTQKVVRLAPREDCGIIRPDGAEQRLYRAVGK